MKIGVMTDIHNNIEALNAVLDKFFSLGIRKIICSGDIIGIGPKPDKWYINSGSLGCREKV